MGKSGKVYLKDIAQEAGVSTALVSYVLNDRHTKRINPDTARRIKDIANRLNYVPDFFAKGLMSKKSQTIGLCIPDLAHPFFTQIARIIELELSKRGYVLLIGSADEDLDKQRFLINTFIQRKVDGLVILPLQYSENDLFELQSKEIPYVLTDRYFEEKPFSYVVTDNYFGANTITKSLLNQGKRKLGLITIESSMEHFLKRKEGFLDACKSYGAHSEVRMARFSDYQWKLDEILDELIEKVDGVVFTTDFLTMYGAKYLLNRGVKVPDEMAVAGFDEAEYYAVFPFPITYYRQSIDDIGKRLIEILIAQIEEEENPLVQEMVRGEVKCSN